MYGLVFELVEAFVLENHGVSTWHEIKAKAGCDIPDKAFLRRSYHNDREFLDLVEAAANILQLPGQQVLEAFGHYWYRHHFGKGGQADLLQSQGATLRTWLSNLNAMHDHIQKSFPSTKGQEFRAPVFWCEGCDTEKGSILLHYFSQRGAILSPMVVGIVSELALYQFKVEVTLTQLALQGQDGSEFTTWRITALDPSQQCKLSPKIAGPDTKVVNIGATMPRPSICPMTGQTLGNLSEADHDNPLVDTGLAISQLQLLFPFHVLVNKEFTIYQVGHTLPSLMKRDNSFFIGKHIGDILHISRPVLGTAWDWRALKKLADQHFFLVPTPNAAVVPATSTTRKNETSLVPDFDDNHDHGEIFKFKGSMIEIVTHGDHNNISNNHKDLQVFFMFALSPDVRSVRELHQMGLVMTDLPLHSCQRDAVFLGDYIDHEVDKAHELDKLSKTLEREKNLSNTLLYNMLPKHIANDLRCGNASEPQEFENMSLFFSDIVGFTNICGQVDPWDVIDTLNQLYSVMDHLAMHFNLYKVETIGDAYVCASGLPFPDEYHADNIANFAIAVMECVKHVKSPADGTPINLRIGIHKGSCTAGVVGTLTHHYCLFGDMVNKTARHEQTGVAGKVQCSSEFFGQLKHFSKHDKEQFIWQPRGLVDMKGKGQCYTYFLEGGTDDNLHAGPVAVQSLYHEVGEILEKNTWKRRTYFRKSGALRGGSVTEGESEIGESERYRPEDQRTEDASDVGSVGVGSIEEVDSERKLDVEQEVEKAVEDDETVEGMLRFVWDSALTREDYVSIVHNVLSQLLKQCLYDENSSGYPDSMDLLDGQLYGFIDRISNTFKWHNRYHTFRHTAHIVAWTNYLFEHVQQYKGADSIDSGPWFRFAITIVALVKYCQHTGVSENQLHAERHYICDLYVGSNCQIKYSVDTGLDILAADFRPLFDEITWGCPRFLHLLRTIPLSKNPLDVFQKVMRDKSDDKSKRAQVERTETTMGIVLKMAALGPFVLDHHRFKEWNELARAEKRLSYLAKRGSDPRPTWDATVMEFVNQEVFPLAEQVQKQLPETVHLYDAAASNLKMLEAQVVTPGAGQEIANAVDADINDVFC